MKKVFLLALMLLGVFSMNAQTKNQIKFTAKIANRNSDTLVIRGANNFKQVIPINSKEVFAATFEAPKGFYQFSDGSEVSALYLKPNSEVNLTMNAKEFDETIKLLRKQIREYSQELGKPIRMNFFSKSEIENVRSMQILMNQAYKLTTNSGLTK